MKPTPPPGPSPARPAKRPKPAALTAHRPDAGPVRTCIVSREERAPADMLRIFAGPDGTAWVEAGGRRKDDGRGAWVKPERAALQALVDEPKRVARALKVDEIDTSLLLERVRALCEARVLDFLSLCARSGRLASGGEGATVAVRAGEAVALLAAVDASATSLADIRGARDIPVYTLGLDKEAFGHRIGKGLRSVVALRGGGPSEELLRWLRVRAALGPQ